MTARTGLTDIISTIRGMCDLGTADYTVGTVSYWSDDQLQDVLDIHRLDVWREPMAMIDTLQSGGSLAYKHYQSEYTFFEKTTGGTSIFYIEDIGGSKVGTANYTPDYVRGHIEFANDTLGTVYFLTGRSYDMNATAADIWRRKAANYAGMFNFSTDNHNISKGALIKNALDMARTYDRFCKPQSTTLIRNDVDYGSIEFDER